ncbi:uncharacterized ATPase [Geminocystis sp. NIES-3708]|nr:uncharacterized ATPase [Geminocystis sp. NIES-3708]
MTKAEIIANNLGSINSQLDDDNLKTEIERLRKPSFVELEAVKLLHDWLENKRHSRQCCRVVGESRNSKTLACNAFRLRHKPEQQPGKAPKVPVVYVQRP